MRPVAVALSYQYALARKFSRGSGVSLRVRPDCVCVCCVAFVLFMLIFISSMVSALTSFGCKLVARDV